MYPTHYWDQGERVIDSYQFQINPDALPGPANFAVGMYTLETLTRLPAIDMNGESLPDNRILLPGPVIIGSGP